MFLSFDHLVKELRRNLALQTYNVTERKMITGIDLLPTPLATKGTVLCPDVAYLCNYWHLKQFDPHRDFPPLICVVEASADADPVFFHNRTVIVIYGHTMMEVMLALSNASYELGCKSSPVTEISHSFLRCRTIPALVEEGFRALKNPILVTDQNQKILYYTNPEQVFHPAYREVLISEYLPVSHPATSTPDFTWSQIDVPYLAQDSIPVPVLCKSLTVGGTTLGYLHVLQTNQEFGDQDISVAELLGNLLTVSLSRLPQAGPARVQDHTERFLRDILDNVLGEAEAVLQRQSAQSITFKPFLYALVFTMGTPPSARRILFSELAELVKHALPGCRSFLYKNCVFALVESQNAIHDFHAFLAPLEPALRQYNLLAGISNALPSILYLRDAGYQASKAIQLGCRFHPNNVIFSYREYAIYYISELCLKNDELPSLCLPELSQLIEHCRTNGTELLDTLRVYLKCGRSKALTANEMYLHVNTVKYRIAQLQELTQLDLSDDDTALQLMLSFKMIEYREKFQTFEPLED